MLLSSGGLAEAPALDAIVGPTFQCLIAEQFRRAKAGDRFFFTHAADLVLRVHSFTDGQLANLKSRRLGDILCDNTLFRKSKENVFLHGPLDLNCCERNELDLSLFA